MPTDPGHEFLDVLEQLCGQGVTHTPWTAYPPINNSGFVANYATSRTEITKNNPNLPTPAQYGDIMQCFDTELLPDSGNINGVLNILLKTDLELSRGDPVEDSAIRQRFDSIKTVADAQAYADAVRTKVTAAQANLAVKPALPSRVTPTSSAPPTR
jgi:hypothetical protein